MLRILYRDAAGVLHTSLTPEALPAALEDQAGIVWLDLVSEPLEACDPILRDVFHFHPLAITDALEETHVPKVDDWQSYLYLVLHAVQPSASSDIPLKTLELDCFLGPNYLVTYQAHPIPALTRLWEDLQNDPRILNYDVSHLLYVLIDRLVADYLQNLEALDEQIDLLEDRLFAQPTDDLLAQIFVLKRTLLRLRRILAPQREVLNKLARGSFSIIPEAKRIYFRDIYDHLVRLYDITDNMRDLVGGALETYLSVVNNRMNDVMKALTIITTLFMPLSFLVGFFGMNFFQPSILLSDWTGAVAFGVTLTAMLALPLGMYYWMRKRGWL